MIYKYTVTCSTCKKEKEYKTLLDFMDTDQVARVKSGVSGVCIDICSQCLGPRKRSIFKRAWAMMFPKREKK